MRILIRVILGLVFVALAFESSSGSEPELDWVYLENDALRVGILRSHGGAIGHLSAADSNVNLLNHYDHGRLVQQSYYGDPDESDWNGQPWRYNPVQGGNYHGDAAELLQFELSKSSAFCKTVPRHWAIGELLSECTMEQTVALEGPLVHMHYEFEYRGHKTHSVHAQETPAVFVNPDYDRLVTYSEDQPWAGLPTTAKTPGWPNEYLATSENWVAYVNGTGKGIGIYVPGANKATAYRFQGGSGSDCSYVAPLHSFALMPGFRFAYDAYLTLGDIETIRGRFRDLATK